MTSTGLEFGPGLAHGRQDVGEAGAGDGEAHAGLAGGAGIAVGHEARALFVADQHMLDARSAAGPGTFRHCGRRECRRSYRRHRLRAGRPGPRRLTVRHVASSMLRMVQAARVAVQVDRSPRGMPQGCPRAQAVPDFDALQRSKAMGQRGWKVQPEGGASGEGNSPFSTMRSRLRVGIGLRRRRQQGLRIGVLRIGENVVARCPVRRRGPDTSPSPRRRCAAPPTDRG